MDIFIRLIRDKSELEGTAYFEFLPGCYSEKHWNDNSVFLEEEVMCMIERPFMDNVKQYDHYSFIDVARDRWQPVLGGLADLKEKLVEACDIEDVRDLFCCIWPDMLDEFADDFDGNRRRLIGLIDDFSAWVKQTLREHDEIAVLGM